MFTVRSAAAAAAAVDVPPVARSQASVNASGSGSVLECGYFVAVFTLRCGMGVLLTSQRQVLATIALSAAEA